MSNLFTRKTKRLVPGMAYQIDPLAQVLAIDQINTEDISLDRGRMTATAVVSTPAVDRDGDIVEQHGLEWTEYQRNPVVFFNHKVNDLPVGRSEDDDGQSTVVVADECTIATCFFNQHNPFAHQIFSLVDDKTLRGTSLGFLVKLAVPVVGPGANMAFARITQGQLDKPRGYRIKSAIVTEWSWVGIGCNPEAVLMHLTKGLIGGEPIGLSLREALEPFSAARLVMASPGGEIIEKVFDIHGRLHGGDPINLGRFSNKAKEPKKGNLQGKKAGGLASGDIRDKIYEDLKKHGHRISSQMYDIQPKWLTFPIRRKLQSDDDQRHSWGGPPAETARFLLREKWEITGNMKDAGYILQDKLEDGKLEEKEPEKKEEKEPEKKEATEDKGNKKKDNYLDTHLMTRIIHYLRHNPHQSASEIRHALKEDGGFDGHISEHPVHLAITKLISDGTVVDEHAGKKGGMSLFSLSKMYLEKGHDTKEGSPPAKVVGELTGKEVNDLASSSGDEETDKRRGSVSGLLSVQSYLSKVFAADKNVTAHRISITDCPYECGAIEESYDASWKSELNYNPAEIVLAVCLIAKGNQYDLFVSKKLGFYQIINKSRPGIEVIFEASLDIKKVQKILDKFTKKGTDGFTIEIHPGDDAGNNKGLRIQYVPEVEMRWDTDVRDRFSGENGEAELKKEYREKRKILLQILKELDTIKGIEAASLNKYDTLVIGKENHGNYDLGRGVGGVNLGLYGSFWDIGGTHTRIQEAASRLNKGEGRDDPYAEGGALAHRDGAKSSPKKGSKKGLGGFEGPGGGGERPLLVEGSANLRGGLGGGGERPLLVEGSANLRGGLGGRGSSGGRSRFVTYHGTGNKSANNAGGARPSSVPRGQGIPVAGGLHGSTIGLAASSRIGPLAHHESLEGLPRKVRIEGVGTITAGPHSAARFAAAEHARLAGLIHEPPQRYARVDKDRAKHIADAYEEMRGDASSTPKGKIAYSALAMETLDQYLTAKKHGLVCEFLQSGQEDPYRLSARLMIEDIKDNHHLWVVPSVPSGTSVVISPEELIKNPMLEDSGEKFGEAPATFDDLFRVVHDYFGHAKEGVGFRSDGQENAWRSHAALFSPKARHAMTTRTRGLNSWLYSGPRGKDHSTGSPPVTVFPPYKTGLLPDWVMREGHGDHEVHSPPLRIPAHLMDAQRLQLPMQKMLAAYYSGRPWSMVKNAEFESKHKRGGSKNPGQFAKQVSSKHTDPKTKEHAKAINKDIEDFYKKVKNHPDVGDPYIDKDGLSIEGEDYPKLDDHVRGRIDKQTSEVGGILAKLLDTPKYKEGYAEYQKLREKLSSNQGESWLDNVDSDLVMTGKISNFPEVFSKLSPDTMKMARAAAAYDVVKHGLEHLNERHKDTANAAFDMKQFKTASHIVSNVWKDLQAHNAKKAGAGKKPAEENDSFGRTSRSGGPMQEDPKRPGWPKGTETWAEPLEDPKQAPAGKAPKAVDPVSKDITDWLAKSPLEKLHEGLPKHVDQRIEKVRGKVQAAIDKMFASPKHKEAWGKYKKNMALRVQQIKAGDSAMSMSAVHDVMSDLIKGKKQFRFSELDNILKDDQVRQMAQVHAASQYVKRGMDMYRTGKPVKHGKYFDKDTFQAAVKVMGKANVQINAHAAKYGKPPAPAGKAPAPAPAGKAPAPSKAPAPAPAGKLVPNAPWLNETQSKMAASVHKEAWAKIEELSAQGRLPEHIALDLGLENMQVYSVRNAMGIPLPGSAEMKAWLKNRQSTKAPAPSKNFDEKEIDKLITGINDAGMRENVARRASGDLKDRPLEPSSAGAAPKKPSSAGAAPKKPSNFHSFTEKLRTHKLTPGSHVKLPDLVKSSLNGVANAVTTSLIASRKRNPSSGAEWKQLMQGNKKANSLASMKKIIAGGIPNWIGGTKAKKAGGKDAKGRPLLTKSAFASLRAHSTVVMARRYATGSKLKKGDIKPYLSMTDYLKKLHDHFKKIDQDYVVQKSLEAAARTPLAAFLAQPMQRMMAAYASYNLVGLSKGLDLLSCDPIVPMTSSSRVIGLPRAALLEVAVPAKLVELSSIDSSAMAIDSNLFPPSTEVSKAVMAGMASCCLKDEKLDQSLLLLCAKLASGVAISKDELGAMADWFKQTSEKDLPFVFNLLGGDLGLEWCAQCVTSVKEEDPELNKKA